jgi:hypothetical protein
VEKEIRLKARALSWRELDGEIVALEADNWRYVAGNAAAALLWRRLAVGATRSELCVALVDAYEIDSVAASRDVDRFLVQAHALEVLEEA